MAPQKHDDPIGDIPIAPAGAGPRKEPAAIPAEAPPEPKESRDARRRIPPPAGGRKWLAVLLPGLLLTLGLGVYFLIPYLLTDSIPHYLESRLHRPVTVGEAEFSLLPLRLTLRHGIIGARTDEPTDTVDPLLSFSELSVQLAPKALLLGNVTLTQLRIDRPFFHLVLQKDGSSNLDSLLAAWNGGQPPSVAGLLPRLLQLSATADIVIDNGRLLVDDKMAGKQHRIEKIVIKLPAGTVASGGNGGELSVNGNPEISAVVNGKPVTLAGRETSTEEGPALDLRLEMHDTDLLPYAPYIPSTYGYRILSGRGDLLLDCLFPRQRKANGSVQLSTTLKLADLRLMGADATEISFGRLDLSANYRLANRQLTIKSLNLEKPTLPVSRQADGSWSFPGRLLPDFQKENNGKPDWRVEELSLRNGTVLFTDLAVKGGFTETFEHLNLSLHNLHPTAPQNAASFSLQAKTGRQATLTMEGKLLAAPLSVEGLLLIDGLPLQPLTPYLAALLGPDASLKSGSIKKATTTLSISKREEGAAAISLRKTDLQLDNLSLVSNGSSYLLPSVSLSDLGFDSASRWLAVGALEIADLRAVLAGKTLFPPLAETTSPPAGGKTGSGEKQWRTTVREAFLQSATVRTNSSSGIERVFHFDKTQLVNLDNSSNKGARLSGLLSFAKKGSLQFSGQLALAPFRAELQILLDGLPLPDFPEFWDGWLNVPVQEGILGAKGVLRLPQLSFAGSFGVDNFKAGSESPVIAWRQLLVGTCELEGRPFSGSMRTVTLDRPYLQWIIREKESPLAKLLKKSNDGSSARHPLKIDDISLDRGRLDFANYVVSPPYLTNVTEVSGTIGSLSNTAGSRSHLSLHGMLRGEAPLSLEGNFGFFDPKIYADFHSRVSDLEIAKLSPYTEPILGYTLTGGLLDMRTTFLQENGMLSADNELTINNLKLGRQLQNLSQLPLTLALLADPDGTIKFSVPVRGNTADSSFSLGGSFLDNIRNLLLRTAVSPFSVLNSLIPKSNALDLDHIAFGFGDAKLTPRATEQIAELAKAVKLRPWLAIAIQGQADAKSDLETLAVRHKQQIVARQLQQERQLSNRLSNQYGNEVIELGKLNEKGGAKETEAELPPSEKDLALLAKERAQEVYQTLLKEGVAARQLRLNERVLIVGANAKQRNGNRVNLKLEGKFPM